MRRTIVPFLALAALALAGCPKKFQNGECETSEHCKDQVGYGKVCVQGRCQECAQDTDCKAGFACKQNKCVPRPECESSNDCPSGKACQEGKCVAAAPTECGPDRACPGDQDCFGGKCVARPKPVEPPKPGPCDVLQPVYFDFDKSNLKPEARATLEQNAKCLKEKPGAQLAVEGNCDERGTAEYNMHLGQRRADSVKKYLSGLGVPARSISTVSFGKEKPICSESTEDCWARNRRADMKAK